MSRVGIGAAGGAWPVDPSIAVAHYFLPQGISADLIATKYGFSRDDVDAYAVESQKRAAAAWDEGRFDRSVMPVKDVNGLTILAKDEHMRPGTTMQSLAALQAVVRADGRAGRLRCGRHPGASRSRIRQSRPSRRQFLRHRRRRRRGAGRQQARAGKRAGLKPRARIRAFANIGSEPALMLTGPVDVTKKVLKKAGMKLGDIDLIEINEAFASVVLRYLQAFDLDPRQGQRQRRRHRAGPSARRHRRDDSRHRARRARAAQSSTALVTLCIGAGMGTATIIERV